MLFVKRELGHGCDTVAERFSPFVGTADDGFGEAGSQAERRLARIVYNKNGPGQHYTATAAQTSKISMAFTLQLSTS